MRPRHTLLVTLIGAACAVAGLNFAVRFGAARSEGPSRGPASSKPNIIFVVVDTVRADHVSAYGYPRPTTPNLAAMVASAGVIFTDAVSAAPWTLPANTAMLTGRSPSHVGQVWSDPQVTIPLSETFLAEYLHDAGYYTAGFVSTHYVRSRFGVAQGFDRYQELVRGTQTSTLASEVNLLAMNWLTTTWAPTLSGTHPLFLYLYYFDPHTWYNAPPPFRNMYDPTYTGTLTFDVYRDSEDVVSGAIIPTARDIQHLKALYDGEITYWDDQFCRMLTFLDGLGLLNNSIIVVTSDHGEMFGEHGEWTHRNALYEEALRVPLIIRYTGVVSAGLVVTAPVQTTDLTPTILDWLGIAPARPLDGVSLRAAAQGQPFTTTRDIFSDMDAITDPSVPGYWLAPRYELRAIKRAGWKYIHHIGLPYADELYELRSVSIYETDNLLADEPLRAATLFAALIDHFRLLTRYTYLSTMIR